VIRLHGYWRSQAALRVRVALALKGLAYEEPTYDLLAGDQHEAGFKALNPAAAVPVLEDGEGAPLTQSLAIIEYLEERHPEPPLLPRDARGRARVRSLALLVAADTHPLLIPRTRARLTAQFGADDAAIASWSSHWSDLAFAAIEWRLANEPETGPVWCHGEAPGLADICLYSLTTALEVRGGSLDSLPPTVRRVALACEAHPAFAPAHSLRQKTTPPPLRRP